MTENIDAVRRVRLKERCYIAGSIHERGDEITLLAGVRGPHRFLQAGHPDRIDYDIANGIDANRIPRGGVDVPLYDVIEEIPPKEPKS